MKETIFALSTVPGLSAIAVFRISGPNAFSVLKNITRGNIPKNRFANIKKKFLGGELLISVSLLLSKRTKVIRERKQ